MTSPDSPFLDVPPSEWIAQNRSGFAIRDAHPVTPGHSLVVPRRIVTSWWETYPDEKVDLLALVDEVKSSLNLDLRPDGYNVGFNSGVAAGQTIDHFHIHIIPRHIGDVDDPRGGIRRVIPDRAGWPGMDALPPAATEARALQSMARARALDLIAGPQRALHPELARSLEDQHFDRIDLVVSFVMYSGLDLIGGAIEDALDRGAQVRVLTTDYLGITERSAVGWLFDRSVEATKAATGKSLEARIFSDPMLSFHPKAYLFWSSADGNGLGFVGSSNVSRSGLSGGIEWNLRTDAMPLLRQGFERLWEDRRSLPLTEAMLDRFGAGGRPLTRDAPPVGVQDDAEVADEEHDPLTVPAPFEIDLEDLDRPKPTQIQLEALAALESTRADGFSAGLVVMATGLGKTWLAAFDSTRPAFRRVLFIAHRDEILRQSRDVFRRVRPTASVGLYMGAEKEPESDIVIAGVQTLVRNLDKFDRDAFDYVVVDEFHHAAAKSYRKVIDHFLPRFLLGLTATPDRMDGADLLALCSDNVPFQCGLVEGIDRSQLVPFAYWGVPDVVDFEPIPWRNGRFDPTALTEAVATVERADHAYNEWLKRRGSRTLAFCVTTLHADFMAKHLRDRGVRAVAVHSGETSAPRHASIAALEAGELDVVCSVDVFNEGLDVPSVDTVLMLRPTESPVIFLQQLGRGLRLHEGKDRLNVIDFIGNHRSFLIKPRTLLSLGAPGAASATATDRAIETGDFSLPDGCSVQYDLEVVELFRRLRGQKRPSDALAEFCHLYAEEAGQRPTAAQAWRSRLNPASSRSRGGWFEFLDGEGLLDADERRALAAHQEFLDAVEATSTTKSYKLVTMRALLHEGGLADGLSIDQLSDAAQRIVAGDPRLVLDVTNKELPDPANANPELWRKYWRKWPIAAWLGELHGQGSKWFFLDRERFAPSFAIAPQDREPLAAMVAELVEYRLARYLDGKELTRSGDGAMVCRVSHAGGRPIIWLDRRHNADMPEGTMPFAAEGAMYEGDFRKEALNVARLPDEPGNALHALLRGWFGPSAGHPGTNHRVVFETHGGQISLSPHESVATEAGDTALPLFPTLAVACGAFADPDRTVHEASTLHLLGAVAKSVERSREFVAFARGDSMDGGDDPVRHGDPLLFEWARGVDRRDLIGQRVLVEYRNTGTASALKRLAYEDGSFILVSDNPDVPPITGVREMQIVARLARVLRQPDINSLDEHIGQAFKRRQIMALHGDEHERTNWRVGHVSLPGQAILLVTLDKAAMPGVPYVDHFENAETMVWSSQTSTEPDGKKGREILNALEAGTQIHLWVRKRRPDVEFTYCGLVVPISHEGSRPMAVTFRLLSPLEPMAAIRLGTPTSAKDRE